jgi:hypothetical protein
MNRLVAPANRRAAASKAGAANEAGYDKAGVLRGTLDADMQVVRATERSTLASGSDPRRSLGSAS